MKINVKNIPQAGVDFTRELAPGELGLDDSGLVFTSAITVSAHVERIINTVRSKVTVAMRYTAVCARCTENIERAASDEYIFTHVVEGNTDTIDLGEDIRQEIILGVPAKILCREDCKGICPQCGAQLNNETCSCEKKETED